MVFYSKVILGILGASSLLGGAYGLGKVLRSYSSTLNEREDSKSNVASQSTQKRQPTLFGVVLQHRESNSNKTNK